MFELLYAVVGGDVDGFEEESEDCNELGGFIGGQDTLGLRRNPPWLPCVYVKWDKGIPKERRQLVWLVTSLYKLRSSGFPCIELQVSRFRLRFSSSHQLTSGKFGRHG